MIAQRLKPCEFCQYPISETHHPYKVSMFGRNKHTIQLCANCHEFYHLVEQYLDGSKSAEKTINHMLRFSFNGDDEHFVKLIRRCFHYITQVKGTRS